jgi:hypothetical protein
MKNNMLTMEQLTARLHAEYILKNISEKKNNVPESEKYRLRMKKIKELEELNLEYTRRIHPEFEVAKRA